MHAVAGGSLFQECLPIQTHGNRCECLKMCSQNKSTKAFFSAVGVLIALLQDRVICFGITLVSVSRGGGGRKEREIK